MALHGMRRQLMKVRILQTNALRGLLAEFGIAMPVGHKQLLKVIQGEQAKVQQDDLLPADLVVSVQEQLKRIDALQNDIDHIAQRLLAMIREDRQMQSLQQIPGVGDLTTSALVAAAGDFSTFNSARQFASWVGLTPRQVGTGGKTHQFGISKRGDTYLRTLPIAGAEQWLPDPSDQTGSKDCWIGVTTTLWWWRWPTRWHEQYGRYWSKVKPLTSSSGTHLSW